VLAGPRGGIFLDTKMGVETIEMEYIKKQQTKFSKSIFIFQIQQIT